MKVFFLVVLILSKEIACDHNFKENQNKKYLTNDSMQDSDQFFTFLDSKFKKSEIEKYIPEEYKDYFESRDSSLWKSLMIFTKQLEYYLPINSGSSKCKSALSNMKMKENLGFTVNMMDSWGKHSDGILWGNFRSLGMYDQCLYLEHNSLKGKYCYIKLTKPKKEIKLQEPQDIVTKGISLSTYKAYAYGTCIPNDCTEEDMKDSLNFTSFLNNKHAAVSCHGPDDKNTLTGGDISFIVYLSIMGVVLTAATALDVVANSTTKSGYLRYLLVFSVSTNFRKLFHIRSPPPKDSISCLHGMRVLSMIWVIYGHQYVFTLTLTENLVDLGRKSDGFLFQIFGNGTFSVDSFFFISGLLVGYLSFKAMSKSNGRLNIIMFYVHRYLRLTPAIAMTCWFQATLSRYLVDGPFSQNIQPYVENCRNNWWKDVTYISNYAVDPNEPGQMGCIEQAWYTATDTQIFVFMPLVLIPLYRYNRIGKAWLGFVTLISCIIPASITVGLDLPPFSKINQDPDVYNLYWKYIYVAPFSRAGPYLIGIGTGYFLFVRKTLMMRKWQVALGWLLSTALALTILFGMYNYNIIGPDGKHTFTSGTQFFYGGFSRTLWAMPLAWIVITCHYGYGGPVNWILSYPAFQPLSRLTYTMFLTAIGMQLIIAFNTKQFYYFTHLNKMVETCGVLFIIGIAAIILSILVEVPLINLEKEIRKKPDSKPLQQNKEEDRYINVQRNIVVNKNKQELTDENCNNNIVVSQYKQEVSTIATGVNGYHNNVFNLNENEDTKENGYQSFIINQIGNENEREMTITTLQ